jgi:xylulokinase
MPQDHRYVIGIDSSTQSVKAIAWDRQGTPVATGRAALEISQPAPLWAEQNAPDWWTATVTALRAVMEQIEPGAIDGVAISNQRETMVLLDAEGLSLAPATLWLDTRAEATTKLLAREIGAETLHAISGKPVDVVPCIYRLRWMRQHTPDLLDSASLIVDVHGYLTRKLTGTAAASWTSADPFGIFDIAAKTWSQPLLDHLQIPVSKLPAVHAPGQSIGTITADAAGETGLRPGTPVFAAGGDGHCAGLGVGAIAPGVVYLNLGTAVVGGMWSPNPDISPYWRTLISPTGTGYLLEAVQRGGAFFINWFVDNFAGGRQDPDVFARLEAQAAVIPVGSDGVTVCTYIVGCMNPHWDGEATASFTGLTAAHTTAHLFRAALEAITLEFARALQAMRGEGLDPQHILAIGGGAANQSWLRMIADATGLPVIRSLSNEASALGAGISAAVGAGWFSGFQSAVDAMTRTSGRHDPDPLARAEWDALSRRQAEVYLNNRSAKARHTTNE